MAEDPCNPYCQAWKKKCTELEKSKQINTLEAEKRDKDPESGFLQNQVCELKSEILSKNQDLANFQQRISECGKEINELQRNKDEELMKTLDEARSKLDLEKAKHEEEFCRVKNQVKSEMKKAEEQMSIAKAYKSMAMEEKSRADRLSYELERNRQKLQNFQNQIQDQDVGSIQLAAAEIKMLRKQLKYEKARVKHVNEVYKMEMGRNQMLQQQVHRIRQEFLQPIQHLDMLDKCLLVSQKSSEDEKRLPYKIQGDADGELFRPRKKKRKSNINLEMHLKTRLQNLDNEMSEFNANASELTGIRDGVLGTILHSARESEGLDQDHMKLFDLDDEMAEQCFREAMKRPLSPLSPAFYNIHMPYTAAAGNEIETTRDNVVSMEIDSSKRTPRTIPRYCVVSSSSTERSSIDSIFRACSEFTFEISGSCLIEKLIKNILLFLQKADGLSSGECSSVLLSLLLEFIPEIAMDVTTSVSNLDSHQLDFFCRQWRAAMDDLDTKRMFGENYDVLLSLLEDFLLNRTVVVCEDECISWSTAEASTDSLLTAGLVLASICVSVDQIGFTCEISYHLFNTSKINLTFSLKLLHLFAHLCGPRYFTLEDYGLEMSVLKSLLVFLERMDSKISPCAACPFSQDVASVEVVVSMLLEKLHSYAYELNSVSKEQLDCFVDILSLVELVGRIMAWSWTFGNIVSPLFRILDSSNIPGKLLSAVIAHLGQLGRIGIEAKGYEDSQVSIVRNWLAGFVCKDSLMGLVDRPFDEVMNTNNGESQPKEDNQSPVVCASNWYSSLSEEEQSSFLDLVRAAV